MSEVSCLQKISNLTEECAYAYFNRKANLEDELANSNEKKSFILGGTVLIGFFGLLISSILYQNYFYISLTVTIISIMASSYCLFKFFKYYSKSKIINNKLFISDLKSSVLLNDLGIDNLLEQKDWNEKELYIIGRCLKAGAFTYLDIIEIKESVTLRYYYEEKLNEWSVAKNKEGNITDISQMTKIKQMRKFEKLLKIKGHRIAV